MAQIYYSEGTVKVCEETTFYKPRRKKGKFSYKHAIPQQGFSFDQTYKTNLEKYLIPAVRQRWDGVLVFSGLEGSGKTTVATATARFLDPNFCLDQVVFTQEDLMEKIDTLPPGSAIVFDEAVLAAMAADAATAAQNALIKKFVTCRKKRLYILLVIPSLFMLRKYFAILRTRALIHTYSPDGVTRGAFKFYGWDTKRKLYIKGYKDYDMGVQKADFIGRFVDTTGLFFDPNAYEDKKDAIIRSIGQKEENEKNKPSKTLENLKIERSCAVYVAYKMAKFNFERICRLRVASGEMKKLKPYSEGLFSKMVFKKYQWKIGPGKIKSSRDEAIRYFASLIEMENKRKKVEKL